MSRNIKISLPINVDIEVVNEEALGPSHSTLMRANQNLIDEIKEHLSTQIELKVTHRKKKDTKNDQYKHIGLAADTFNDQIRNALKGIGEIHFETALENGALFERKRKSDFDFSFYNKCYNYSKLWNQNRAKVNFDTIIDSTIQVNDKEEWDSFLEEYRPIQTTDCIVDDDERTIVGEIQVGNWGLVYKDIFRLLRAKNSPGVNLYIYITATGFLRSKLSDVIVYYEKALKEFKQYMDIINMPILVLGIDIKNPDIEKMEELHKQVLEQVKELAEEEK